MNEKLIADYKVFLDNGKTERECVAQIIEKARAAGYKNVLECAMLKAGDKVYAEKWERRLRFLISEAKVLKKE